MQDEYEVVACYGQQDRKEESVETTSADRDPKYALWILVKRGSTFYLQRTAVQKNPEGLIEVSIAKDITKEQSVKITSAKKVLALYFEEGFINFWAVLKQKDCEIRVKRFSYNSNDDGSDKGYKGDNVYTYDLSSTMSKKVKHVVFFEVLVVNNNDTVVNKSGTNAGTWEIRLVIETSSPLSCKDNAWMLARARVKKSNDKKNNKKPIYSPISNWGYSLLPYFGYKVCPHPFTMDSKGQRGVLVVTDQAYGYTQELYIFQQYRDRPPTLSSFAACATPSEANDSQAATAGATSPKVDSLLAAKAQKFIFYYTFFHKEQNKFFCSREKKMSFHGVMLI